MPPALSHTANFFRTQDLETENIALKERIRILEEEVAALQLQVNVSGRRQRAPVDPIEVRVTRLEQMLKDVMMQYHLCPTS